MKYTLKQWRGVKEMTQDELAERSGVSRMKIALHETITAEDVQKLRMALELKSSDHIIMP